MIEFLQNALKSPSGSFGFVFALLMLAFWVTYQVAKWTTKLKHVDKLDANVDKIKEDISTRLKHVDKLEANVDKIKEDISEIKAFITVFKETSNSFAKTKSPVALTDSGVKVANDLKIDDLVIKHWDAIHKDLSHVLKNDGNPYDIQQESIAIGRKIEKYLDANELDMIKRYAFIQGHNLLMYDMLIGVIIRDMYFKKHNINVSDIDKHDPNKK